MTEQHYTTFKTRILTWILFLCFIHTIPVPWYLVQAAGTAPAFALFLVGVNGIFSISAHSLGMLGFFLIPALIYFLIFYLMAKLCHWVIRRISLDILKLVTVIVAVIILFGISINTPIYVAGGHGSNTYSNAHEIIDIVAKQSVWFKYYYHALTLLFVYLFLVFQFPDLNIFAHRTAGSVINKRHRIQLLIALVVVGFIYNNRVLFLYKPLAEFNSTWAQIRIGDQLQAHKFNELWGNQDPAYWYQRAANNGSVEAMMIMYRRSMSHKDRIYWLEIAAKEDHGEAQYLLFRDLMRYKPDASTIDRAYKLLEKATTNDYAEAQYTLASVYANQHGDRPASYKKDLKKSRDLYERAAGNDYIPAMQLVASRYELGESGFPVDKKRAREIYKTLARHFKQHPDNQALPGQEIATDYENRVKAIDTLFEQLNGLNTTVLKKTAIEFLQASSASSANRQQGLRYLLQAAEQEDAEAAYQLGEIYSMGRYSIDKDLQKARNWWEQASDGGQRDAMERIANGNLNGNYGYQTDLLEARKQVERLVAAYGPLADGNSKAEHKYKYWKQYIPYIEKQMQRVDGDYQSPAKMDKLINNNDVEAQFLLGRQMLETGNLNEKQHGIELLRKAANSGHIEACYLLVSRYAITYKIFERYPDQARSYLYQAAAAGHPRAMSQLAFAYEKGRYGIKQDLTKAITFFQKTVTILESQKNNSREQTMFLELNKSRIDVVKRMLNYQQK